MSNPRPKVHTSDEGSALILALVLILVGTMLVLPVMKYTMSVTRANRVTSTTADRVEEVKAGLRVALYDPVALYQACHLTGPSQFSGANLAVPQNLAITTRCNAMSFQTQYLPSEQRYGVTVVQAGATIPTPNYVAQTGEDPLLDGTLSPVWCTSMIIVPVTNPTKVPCGRPYPGNGNTATTAWLTDTKPTIQNNTVWTPPLPPFANTLPRPNVGFDIAADQPCKVFFPGRYTDDVTIVGPTPVYFVSGVYYFEKAVRISGDAKVVVGAGAVPGCVDSDAIAVGDVISPPYDISSSGVGGTFVFGVNGRLVVDTATAGSVGMSLSFNRRLVEASDPLAALNDISIMSVNGLFDETLLTTSDLDVPGQLFVRRSPVLNGSTTDPDPYTHTYKASKLISTLTPAAPCALPLASVSAACPIIDINLTTAAKVNLKIPGYVAIPQGSLSLRTTAPQSADNKTIAFGGGILAAQMTVSGPAPSWMQLGLLNPIVQKTFKITTESVASDPKVTSIALVQVNETGGYAVNTWVVQSNCGSNC